MSEEEIISIWNMFASVIDIFRRYAEHEDYEQRKMFILTFFFNHIEYTASDRPEDFEKNLSNIFIVKVFFIEEDMTITAEGKFFDKQPAITREKREQIKFPAPSDLD